MVYATGKAIIKHEKTGQIYEIESELLEFETVAACERGMGPENVYSAVLDHPELGQLVWSISEYPVNLVNYRETDVGPHALLGDINFGLENDAPNGEEEWWARIDSLVKWFHERYEDPAQRLPYISKEGGYQWIHGGPYDAREVLAENFPEETEEVIEAAVEEIESDGLTDWAPVSKPEDYDEYYYDEKPEPGGDSQEIVSELDSLISDLPIYQAAPEFCFGDDGRIHLSSPLDIQPVSIKGEIFEVLSAKKNDLLQALVGTNAHRLLLQAVEQYSQAFLDSQNVSISRLYAYGIILENTASVIKGNIESDMLPALPPNVEVNLRSTLELHRTYIMSHEEGRNLVDAASAYHRSPEETQEIMDAGNQILIYINDNPKLFGDDARKYIEGAVQIVGEGSHPERSNQIAVATIHNIFFYMLHVIKNGTLLTLTTVAGAAFMKSIPGVTTMNVSADAINAAWHFLSANISSLKLIVASIAPDTSWVTSLSHLSNHLKNLQRKDD